MHRSGRFHLRPRRRAQGGGDRSRRAPGLRRGRDYPRAVREVSSGGAAPPVVALGEAAWTVVLGDRVDRALHERVTALATALGEAALPGVLEIVPAYAAVTVFFDPAAADADALSDTLARMATDLTFRPSVLPSDRPSAFSPSPSPTTAPTSTRSLPGPVSPATT
ncbi:MAG: hypothetical protein DMD43_09175 [Gemmatimonadetes bacterium]|nr:MAG: hypothetical protein DMD43_09175 [Gemmatimonadota bacterium]